MGMQLKSDSLLWTPEQIQLSAGYPHWRTCINRAAHSQHLEIWLSTSSGDTWKSGCLLVMMTLGNKAAWQLE